MSTTPEQSARLTIDAALEAAGWTIQNRDTEYRRRDALHQWPRS